MSVGFRPVRVLRKFVPITKVEEQADGTLHVYGLVTAEQPDRDKEVCDYAKTKPYYKATVDEMLKATDVPGMEPSIMPLREMHQLKAVGKGISIDFDDVAKTISMGFEVVDPEACRKVKKGVLPAFSQGGNYVEIYKDPTYAGCKRYVADPGEVSLVDRGCLPAALISEIKQAGAQFEYHKANGAGMELRKFAMDPEPTDATGIIPAVEVPPTKDKAKNKAAIFQSLGTKQGALKAFYIASFAKDFTDADRTVIKAALGKNKISVNEEAEKLSKAVEYLNAGGELEKGMYEVSRMAQLIETLSYLQASVFYEAEYENDGSAQPAQMDELLTVAITVFTAMVAEETSELAALATRVSTQTAKGAKAMTQDELNKAAKDILEKAKSASGHLKSAHAAMGKAASHMATHMGKAQGHIQDCAKALGLDPVDGGEDNSDPVDGAPHTHKGYDFVSIGKSAEGVEIFKRVKKASDPFDMDELVAKLAAVVDEKVEKKLDAHLISVVKASLGVETDEELEALGKAATPGIGNRELVIPNVRKTPVATIPVTKADDAQGGGAPANGAIDIAKMTVEQRAELVKKASAGDLDSRLALVSLNKAVSPEEAARITANLGIATHR